MVFVSFSLGATKGELPFRDVMFEERWETLKILKIHQAFAGCESWEGCMTYRDRSNH